jgi:arylsulfatase A-like enzyme
MNLLLITIDALRADHLTCLGYSRKITPNLDDFASTGVLFTQAISTSHMTPTSFVSMLTSTFPLMNGGWFDISKRGITLPLVLKAHGYHTGAFLSNPFLSSYYGYHKGFDFFDNSIPESGIGMKMLGKLLHVPKSQRITPFAKAQELNKKAITWLHDNRDDFFLWLHYMDVHGPYGLLRNRVSLFRSLLSMKVHQALGHSKYRAMKSNNLLPKWHVNRRIDSYDAHIRYEDKMFGSLFHKLTELDILKDTLVVVTADHGQQFMEHGYYGHRFGLYDQLIHVPLIIVGPGLKRRIITQQVSLLDLAPTILDIVGIEKPRSFLGDSLLGLMRGSGTELGRLGAISETDVLPAGLRLRGDQKRLDAKRRVISFRTDKWKYIYTEGGQDELYCLETDPGERENLIDTQPETAAKLRGKIVAHIQFEESKALRDDGIIKAKIRKLKDSGKI